MKRRIFGVGFVTLILTLFVTGPNAYGQDPDVTIVNCNPSDVHYGNSVTVSGTVTNVGTCYIVLGDAPGDTVDYDFNNPTGITGYKIKLRMRSSSGGDLVTAHVWLDAVGFQTVSTSLGSWTWVETTFPGVMSGGPHTLYVQFFAREGTAELEIDKVSVTNTSDNSVYSDEAENYDSGRYDIDAIHPSAINVKFYDGDPAGGGTQFGFIVGQQSIYDRSDTIEGGQVYYLSEGGSDNFGDIWVSNTPSHHDIYVEIDTYSEDLNTANNKEFDQASVYATMTIQFGNPYYPFATMSPSPGTHHYYGTNQQIQVFPGGNWAFHSWQKDGSPMWSTSNPEWILMSQDVSLVAWLVGSTVVSFTNLTAIDNGADITVRWNTETEMDNAGFNVYRSTGIEDARTLLNGELIQARGNELRGANYAFNDWNVTDGTTYYYWIEDVNLHGKTATHGPVEVSKKARTPTVFSLAQNSPNPFNPLTEIQYDLPRTSRVRLEVYNVLGQRVATLVDDIQTAGTKVARWNGKNDGGVAVSGGVYFYRLEAGEFVDVKKMVLLK